MHSNFQVLLRGYSHQEMQDWANEAAGNQCPRDVFSFTGTMNLSSGGGVYCRYEFASKMHAMYAQLKFGQDVPQAVLDRYRVR